MKLGVWQCFSASDSSATPIPTKYRPLIAPIAIFWLGVQPVGPAPTQHLIQVPNFMATDMKMGIWRGFLPSEYSKTRFYAISTRNLAPIAPFPSKISQECPIPL